MQYFITKISDKQELQQIAFNHSSDIDFKYFTKNVLIFFLVVDTALASVNPLRLRENLFERI